MARTRDEDKGVFWTEMGLGVECLAVLVVLLRVVRVRVVGGWSRGGERESSDGSSGSS